MNSTDSLLLRSVCFVVVILFTTPLRAQTDYFWSGNSNTEFFNSANWVGGIVPSNSSASRVNFTAASYSNQPTWGNVQWTLNGFVFGDGTNASGAVTFTSTNEFVLLRSGGITMNSNAGSVTFNQVKGGWMRIEQSQTWLNNSANVLLNNGNVLRGYTTNDVTLTFAGTGQINPGNFNQVTGNVFKVVSMTGNGVVRFGQSDTTTLTTLNSGRLSLLAENSLGTGGLTINGGTLSAEKATLNLSGNGAVTINSNFTYSGFIFGTFTRTNYTMNWGGRAVTLGTNVAIDTFSGDLQIGGAIGDGGNGRGLTKTGDGTLTLAGANTHSGVTTVSAGTLALSNVAALQNSTLDTGSTGSQTIAFLVAGANTYNLGGLQGADALAISSNTISVGANNANTAYSGVLSGTGGSLTKNGTGTLTLSGANTYSAGTRVSAGTLLFTNGGSVAGEITNNATLAYHGSDASTVTNTISGSGALAKAGNGTLTLSGANSYTGATTVAGGTLRIDGNSRLGNTTNTLTISNAAVLEVTAAGALTNAMTIGAGNGVLSNSSAGALVLSGGVTKNGTVFTSRSGSGTNIFTGVISGASANSDFVVDGGTTVFSNQMTYNGPTIVINGGTLNLGTNNAIPTGSPLRLGTNATAGTVNLQGNNQTVASLETQGTAGTNNLVTLGGGTLTIDGGVSTTYAGAITGTGTVQKSGAGTITLSGSVTATNLRISAGAVALGDDNVLGNTLNLDLNGGTFIVGSGGTRYTDTLGTLTLSASSTIDMGATGGLGTITFANSSGVLWATNAVLTITNWQGVASQQSDVTKLLFGTGGLTSMQLGQIRFANQNIDGGLLLGDQGELAPIPEAPVAVGATALAAFVLWRERRRLFVPFFRLVRCCVRLSALSCAIEKRVIPTLKKWLTKTIHVLIFQLSRLAPGKKAFNASTKALLKNVTSITFPMIQTHK